MDFVKTLLLYMGLTVATTLQAAPAPEETPISQTTSIVVAADGVLSQQDASVTPGPTMTPNPAYKTLQVGSKGTEVRRLQERLRELGYLSGNVDGAYGYQTRNAVLLFQTYNGLSRDGVAGKATQTKLYEDETVLPNPETVTPSPVPTATPDDTGLVPVSGNPKNSWMAMDDARVMLNGDILRMSSGKMPEVYLRGDEAIISLTSLAEAAGWELDAGSAQTLTLSGLGYNMMASMNVLLKNTRDTNDTSYCDAYDLSVNGSLVDLEQGELISEGGEWFATLAFLEDSMHATGMWDAEENTLVLTILERSLAESRD